VKCLKRPTRETLIGKWIALVDGDKKQRRYLLHEAKKQGLKLTLICDFIHVLEYLWDAGHVFFKESDETEQWVAIIKNT
jgi:hypothetical protein